jgi:PKD repeat protein
MTVSDASNMNFSSGKEYMVQLTGAEIGIGNNNTFYFYAHDGTYQAIGDIDEIKGPIVNLGTPVAEAGSDITVEASTVFRLDGSGSYDSDGTIVSYSWDFNDQEDKNGDGIFDNDDERTDEKPSWKYNEPGEYIVTLTIMDDQGIPAKDTIKVTVTEKEEDDESDFSNIVVYSLIIVIIIIIILVIFLLMVRKKVKEEQEYEKFKKRRKKGKTKKEEIEEEEE